VFAIALVDQQTAENLTTGAVPPSEVLWQSGLPVVFPQALMQLFWRQGHPANAHFVFGEVIEKEVRPRTIVNVTTGEVIYAANDFASDILSPYTRVAAAVLERDGRIWAIMPRGLARWVLPGGHIDAGESPRAAVVREMLEETGQHIRVQRLIGTLYRPWSRTMVFLCANITKHKDWSSTDETDAVLAIDFRDLATDERLFLQRHGITARWTEAS
jgi:8-oxo-dGTP pyrophosphatase MutT (NUDIX family)